MTRNFTNPFENVGALTSVKPWHCAGWTPSARSRRLCRNSFRLLARSSARKTGCLNPNKGQHAWLTSKEGWPHVPVTASPPNLNNILHVWHLAFAQETAQKRPLCMKQYRQPPSVDRFAALETERQLPGSTGRAAHRPGSTARMRKPESPFGESPCVNTLLQFLPFCCCVFCKPDVCLYHVLVLKGQYYVLLVRRP